MPKNRSRPLDSGVGEYDLLCAFLAKDYSESEHFFTRLLNIACRNDPEEPEQELMDKVSLILACVVEKEFCLPEYSPLLADEPVISRGRLCLELKDRLEAAARVNQPEAA